MGGIDSSTCLERIVRKNFIEPFAKLNLPAYMGVYRDNLYYGCNDVSVEVEILRFIAQQAQALNLKFGSGRVGSPKLDILGFEMGSQSIAPLRRNLEKIQNFPTPNTKKEVRKFLGMTNYYRWLIASYDPSALEQLLKKSEEFSWGAQQQECFERLKKQSSLALVAPIKVGKRCVIYTDASGKRLGAILVQEGKIVAYWSKGLSESQQKYSVTRREALAVLGALKHWRHLLTPDSVVLVDHLPLEGWARGANSEDELLQRWGLRFQEHHVRLQYIRGESNIADGPSRNLAQVPVSVVKDFLRGELDVKEFEENDLKQIERTARRYNWRDSQLWYKGKLVPDDPRALLRKLHLEYSHPSATALAKLIRTEYDWETCVMDCEAVTTECDSCERGEFLLPDRSTGFIGKRSDWRVLDEWSYDLLPDLEKSSRGFTQLMVAVEAVSRYVEVFPLRSRTSKETASCLAEMICRYGAPRRVRVDQGSEFEGEFKALADELGIFMKVASSHHPQGNGQTERMNRDILDRIVRSGDEDWDVQCLLAAKQIRQTPSRRTGISPHEILFGEAPRINRIRDPNEVAPLTDDVMLRRWRSRQELQKKVQQMLQMYEASFQSGVSYKVGDLVWVRNFKRAKFDPRWLGPVKVIELPRGNSVKIKGETGVERVVNLGDLKPYRTRSVDPAGEHDVESTAGSTSDATVPNS